MDSLSTTLAALCDPTRRSILARLASGPASVNELAAPFSMSQQSVSKHLAVLEKARLIEQQREGRQNFRTLRPAPFKEVADWVEQYRRFWEDSFDRLDDLLLELKQERSKEKKNVRKARK